VTERVFSGAPWEKRVGYCRAIRNGQNVYVSGTAPVDESGAVFAPGDGYAQARRCLDIIDQALQSLKVDRASIVRTRMFVTDITRWAEFGRAHAEFFGEDVPVTSMVEVRRLIDPEMLIEIEADAVLHS
jgi:enamine deaminase RidA (YjgF/YER057c/UK114 family)